MHPDTIQPLNNQRWNATSRTDKKYLSLAHPMASVRETLKLLSHKAAARSCNGQPYSGEKIIAAGHIKQTAYRVAGRDALDRRRKQLSNRHLPYFPRHAIHIRRQWDGVCHHQLLKSTCLDFGSCQPIEEAVCSKSEDAPRTKSDELIGGRAERSRCVDNVVDNDAVTTVDRAHEVRLPYLPIRPTLLDDHRQRRPLSLRLYPLAKHLGSGHAARVRRDYRNIIQLSGRKV
mmetsp:Transcript_16904/g.28125  ORF Transcript_16904/g.28125 Transcript_16904/m.28125 type:complete len:231 (+) Transcript_16904:119-811(+)